MIFLAVRSIVSRHNTEIMSLRQAAMSTPAPTGKLTLSLFSNIDDKTFSSTGIVKTTSILWIKGRGELDVRYSKSIAIWRGQVKEIENDFRCDNYPWVWHDR